MLTSKQRAQLRALANNLDPIFQIGKDGLNENLVKSVSEALERRELVKVSILENSDEDVRDACAYIAGRVGAEQVQCIGRRFVLYRESQKYKTIELVPAEKNGKR